VAHQSFWITNAIRVTANKAIMQELAARPEVKRVVSDGVYFIPRPLPGQIQPRPQGIEWNIERVRAPEAWATFGTRGEGIIVANIDTGVQFDHPALVTQYRGNLGEGNFDHNYNWFDPSNVCGSPSLEPCDNVAHGTHTMGIMVGDDGDPGPNQTGVAPHARWIAVKGCEDYYCSYSALLAAGQWVLAPTDLNGQNPRPDLRPHIVNNSWGGGSGDPFYQEIVDAWIAAGIFPAFSNGNSGSGCASAGSPGDYVQTYSAGAFDINNSIADFSSRGPSAFFDEFKPNITAPGVDVRSSVPGGYESFSGTSMAAPHVTGTVALLWSAASPLIGDIATTRGLLDQTALDTADLGCGGTEADNNVWGEGRLDAFAAVEVAPRGPTGRLRGQASTAGTGQPIAGATVRVVGPTTRTITTDDAGRYSLRLPVGTYDVMASAFGFRSRTVTGVVVSEDRTTVRNVALRPAPAFSVSGMVRNNGNPVANATVSILGTPIPSVRTDANGVYRFASVPAGEYDVRAEAGRCNDPQSLHLVVRRDTVQNFTLPQRFDNYGYSCHIVPFNFVDANTVLPLTDDDAAIQVNLPFPFPFYGQTYERAYVTTNGFLNFLALDADYGNISLPNPSTPNAAIYLFWDDLYVDGSASVRTELLGTAPNRQFVIEWRDVAFCCVSEERVRFEVILFENGRILTQYTSIDANGREQGDSATVGLEDETGTTALQYSFDQPTITDGLAVLYTLPPSGFIAGPVTDAVDEQPVVNASVRALQDGTPVRQTTTNDQGFYRLQVPVGTYTVEVTARDYVTGSAQVEVAEDQTVMQHFALEAARAQIVPGALEFLAVPGQVRARTLMLQNNGQADLTFTIAEIAVEAVASAIAESAVAAEVASHTASPDYVPTSVRAMLVGGPTLVFMDFLPWGTDALLQVLTANAIPFDTASSGQMGTIDLSRYQVVFISSDQPQEFYNNYNANRARFSDFVAAGGFLWIGAAAWGWNGGDFNGAELPGGAWVHGPIFEDANDVIDNAHPTMQGIPDPFFGTSASHSAFENLPSGTNVIAQGQSSGLPTLIEYPFGRGVVLALGQTLEFGFQEGQDAGRILENGVPYAATFDTDVPWLFADPVSGTVEPGATQAIQVEVDTTGLQPGLYRARLLLRTNDPRHPQLRIAVTLIVPAYQQAVNAGGDTYIDLNGDCWEADQMFVPGIWGYVDASQSRSTRRAIAGTDDDPLYQDLREDVLEYRFDEVPPGVYEVDLRFAEIRPQQPNRRVFHILIEGSIELFAHDIALAVGSLVADQHIFFVTVTDGQLNVRFLPWERNDQPIVNAIRVTHRPDR
jgi:hypothetical protein